LQQHTSFLAKHKIFCGNGNDACSPVKPTLEFLFVQESNPLLQNHGFLKFSGGTRLSLGYQNLRDGTGSALDAVHCPSPH
jgi:hypothetical protein